MKVQTSAGEVELTPEMVRPGMVLRANSGRMLTLAGTERIAAAGVWRTTDNLIAEIPEAVARDHLMFLGCDPAIAARADCERYGIAPGIDAGAHGFARLRDGGAVDLRREHLPNGSITYSKAHGRTAVLFNGPAKARPLWGSERFVGLNGRHACREDMGRLCCDAVGPEQHNDEGCPWTPRCTLAIGGHDEHENIVTGAKWAAKAGFNPPGTYHCLGCDEKVRHGTPHDCAAEMEQRERRKREATLVALVNAVPEGLDPVGWRAAVLSVCEGHIYNMRDPEQAAEFFRSWPECAAMVCQFARSGRKPDYDGCALRACNAYARAIAPQGPRPVPFRRKAPGLPVDMGDE